MALTNAERQARYRGAAEGLEAVELPRASGVTARPPATASGGRPRRGAGRRHREAVDAGGVVLPGSDPPPGRTASLSEGRRRVAAGRPHCARPPQRYGPSRDTPPAPRLGGQLGALRPGLDARVPTVHNVPGTRRATELRTPPPDRNRRSRCRGTPPFGRRADGGVGLVRRGGRRNHGTGDRPWATDASRPSTGRADRRSLTRTAALGWSRRRRATADPRRAPRAPNSSARAGLTCWPETGRPRPRPWQIMSVQRAPAHRSPRQDPCFRPLIRPPSPRLTCRRFRLISGLERTPRAATVLRAARGRRRFRSVVSDRGALPRGRRSRVAHRGSRLRSVLGIRDRAASPLNPARAHRPRQAWEPPLWRAGIARGSGGGAGTSARQALAPDGRARRRFRGVPRAFHVYRRCMAAGGRESGCHRARLALQ